MKANPIIKMSLKLADVLDVKKTIIIIIAVAEGTMDRYCIKNTQRLLGAIIVFIFLLNVSIEISI